MRALWLQPDREWLEERRKRGLDSRDEVWDGVLHVVPPPSFGHQEFGIELAVALRAIAMVHGFKALYELGTFDPAKGETNYRVPDLVVVDPQYVTARGVEGRVELAVEILSPNDESRDKFDFYATCCVQEVWIADPATRVVEVYVLRGERYFMVAPDRSGVVHAPRFGVELEVVPGPKLKVSWADGSAEI